MIGFSSKLEQITSGEIDRLVVFMPLQVRNLSTAQFSIPPGTSPSAPVIPIAASATTALAFRASYQAGQQRECSQACPWGSVP